MYCKQCRKKITDYIESFRDSKVMKTLHKLSVHWSYVHLGIFALLFDIIFIMYIINIGTFPCKDWKDLSKIIISGIIVGFVAIYYNRFYITLLKERGYAKNKFGDMKKSCSMILLFVALGITACKNGTQKEVPGDTEADSAVVMSDHPIYDQLLAELDSTEIYDDSILYGYWFKPHEASSVNIFFHKDNTFEFKYYIVQNDTTIIDVVKRGTYSIGDEDVNKTCLIKMVADDGWDNQVFNGMMYRKHNRTNYYMTNKAGDLYLVKGSD